MVLVFHVFLVFFPAFTPESQTAINPTSSTTNPNKYRVRYMFGICSEGCGMLPLSSHPFLNRLASSPFLLPTLDYFCLLDNFAVCAKVCRLLYRQLPFLPKNPKHQRYSQSSRHTNRPKSNLCGKLALLR